MLSRYDWPVTLVWCGLMGLLEGMVMRSLAGGYFDPGTTLWVYWSVMASVMWLGLMGWFAFANSSLKQGFLQLIAFVPFSVVWQDAFSLHAQELDPVKTFWYSSVFGDNVLTQHWLFLPNFYYVGFGLTVFLDFVVDYFNPQKA